MKTVKIISILLAGIYFTGCNSDSPSQENNERRDITLSRAGEEVVASNNEFALRLLEAADDGLHNVVLSPLSLYQYLSMVANGAEGETRKEIEGSLCAGELSISDINAINSDLASGLMTADKKTAFSMANSLWYSEDASLRPEYVSLLKDQYNSEIFSVGSLNCEDLRRAINGWCEQKTSGIVKDFLRDDIGSHIKYVSYTATYFRSEWSKPFRIESEGTFHNIDGSLSTVTYMRNSESSSIYDIGDFRYIEIPYGNGAFVFTAVLPKDNEFANIGGINANINEIKMSVADCDRGVVRVTMPKFRVDYKNDMKEVLSELGIRKAFSPDADFSKASDTAQCLPDVLHAASLDVDERGTVAVSVSGSGNLTANISEPLIIDRPFVFYIKEISTSAILYIGKINRL